MTNLLEAYRQLNKLYESKVDQEAFISKFGKNYFDLFNKFKGKLQSKNISTDIVWHVKHTSVEEMKEILDNFNNNIITDDNGKANLNRKKIFEDDNFIVWQILDWETAMNMGEGASWCIAGRYQTTTPKPSQAEHYFNKYLETTYDAYYFVIKKSNQEKWCICKKKNKTLDIWNKYDKTVDKIEGLPTIKEIGYVEDIRLLVAQQFFKTEDVIYHENDDVYSANGDTRICSVIPFYGKGKDIQSGYLSMWENELCNSIMNEGLNSSVMTNVFRLAHVLAQSMRNTEVNSNTCLQELIGVLNSYFYGQFTTRELFNICTSIVDDENYENEKVSKGLKQVIISLGEEAIVTHPRDPRNKRLATIETFDVRFLANKFHQYAINLFDIEDYNWWQVFSTCLVDSPKMREYLVNHIFDFINGSTVCMHEIENHVQGVMGQGQVACRDPNSKTIYIAYEV